MKSNFKCAHPACTCSVGKEDEYCGVYRPYLAFRQVGLNGGTLAGSIWISSRK